MRSQQTSEYYTAAIKTKEATREREVALFKQDLKRMKKCRTWSHMIFLVEHLKEKMAVDQGTRAWGDSGRAH